MEQWRQFINEGSKFKLKGDSEYFRIDLQGIGYAQGMQHLRFKECQSDVDALMETPEFIKAKEKYEANNTWGDGSPKTFRPRFYDIENAWITNPEQRGKGYGKEIYKAFIAQAAEYAKSYGGVFVGAHHCTIGSGTSPEARRVWKSITRDYTSSGDVIFIGL